MADEARKILYRVARSHFDEGKSKTEISRDLNISVTHVGRLLSEAREKKIVSVVYSAPRVYELEESLRLQFRLREAVVVETGPAMDLQPLGIAAATFFEKRVRRNPGMLVGLGGGRTLYEMVEALPELERNVRFVPTTILGRGPYIEQIDPAVLATLLWAKSGRRPKSAYNVTVPAFDRSSDAESLQSQRAQLLECADVRNVLEIMKTASIVFVGVGVLTDGPEGGSTAVEFCGKLGISRTWLSSQGVVGDIGYSLFDENGNCSPEWEFCLGLTATEYRRIAADRDRDVVLVAGYNKTPAIRAALRGGLASVLITDQLSAEELLDLPQSEIGHVRSHRAFAAAQ